jgi:U3 small nucleolar RNA-associated protein 3
MHSDAEDDSRLTKQSGDEDDSDGSGSPDEGDEEELGAWGESKQDYYGGDEIETEQAALEEEAEARRLQQKQLQGMSEADFGFDEVGWADGEAGDEGTDDGVVTEVLPQLDITEDMGPEERTKQLKSRYPEFEPISKEFLVLQSLHGASEATARTAKEIMSMRIALDIKQGREPLRSHAAIIKHQALSAYLGTMALYFAVLTSTANVEGTALAKSPLEMRDHPVMESLVQSRQLWNKIKDLPLPDPAEELAAISRLTVIEAAPQQGAVEPTISKSALKRAAKAKIPIKEREALAAQAEAEARRASRLQQLEEDLATLSNITSKPSRTKQKTKAPRMVINEDDSDFGDETELTAHELAEKAKRKKSLKFYTAQIAQKANKRGTAGKDAGGDADIPYRERLKDRQARLNAEAEKRGKKVKLPGDDLGGESDEEDRKQAKALREEGDDADEYLDLISSRSKAKKESKIEAAEAYAKAAKEGGEVYQVEVVGEDGKRKISYQIEKNKGLTPHRKKDVRNPRVKKRKAYEEKKKKLGSMKQIWKGGEGKGGYKGELTGIKTGLVRGVKL